ncbi:MAG: hypothetical protein IT374_08730 [Polyangiaceae bacterium]|nr:hypothetical protein [Polyangiaceae bacterium]
MSQRRRGRSRLAGRDQRPPPEPAKDLLAEPIAVARGRRGVVGRAVTLHAEQVLPGWVRVKDGEIDPVAAATDLRVDPVPGGHQRVVHLALDLAVEVTRSPLAMGVAATLLLGVAKERLEVARPGGPRARQIDLVVGQPRSRTSAGRAPPR